MNLLLLTLATAAVLVVAVPAPGADGPLAPDGVDCSGGNYETFINCYNARAHNCDSQTDRESCYRNVANGCGERPFVSLSPS